MTGKQRMLKTLRFEEPDRAPHFEAMFELEKQAFGLEFPDRTLWEHVSGPEKARMVATCMEIYERIVERYAWDALVVCWPWADPDGVLAARRTFGDELLIGGIVGGGVWAIEVIADWTQFAVDLYQNRAKLHEEAEAMCGRAIDQVDRLVDAGAEFIFLVHDIAFNAGPFISPQHCAELVTPYLTRLVQRVKQHGAVAIVHSDGQLMPILDQIVSTGADALQSIDPMAGMDIARVKRQTYGKLALMGNVQCNLLQDGPREAIRASALYCLENAAPGGGYIFSTSNTVFQGMPLENYEYMLEVFAEYNGRSRPCQ